jgi:hypothetical protein
MALLESFKTVLMRGKISVGNETFTVGSLPLLKQGYTHKLNNFGIFDRSDNYYRVRINQIEDGYSKKLAELINIMDRYADIYLASVVNIEKNRYDLLEINTVYAGSKIKKYEHGKWYCKGLTTDEVSQIKSFK